MLLIMVVVVVVVVVDGGGGGVSRNLVRLYCGGGGGDKIRMLSVFLVCRAYRNTTFYTTVRQIGEYLISYMRGGSQVAAAQPMEAVMSFVTANMEKEATVLEVSGARGLGRPASKR